MATNVQKLTRVVDLARPLLTQTTLLKTLLICSVVLNLLLALQGRTLRKDLAARATKELNLGTVVPTLNVLNMEGRPVSLTYADTRVPTVVYVFSPDCHWCARNADNVKQLVTNAGQRYRFVGVSLSAENLTQYVSENELPFQVYSSPTELTRAAYKMGGTPQTLVISSEGKLLKNWIGAYSRDVQSEVEAFFETKLPGLTSERKR
jgi:peroxiredoxin